jgi:hypothetical protein
VADIDGRFAPFCRVLHSIAKMWKGGKEIDVNKASVCCWQNFLQLKGDKSTAVRLLLNAEWCTIDVLALQMVDLKAELFKKKAEYERQKVDPALRAQARSESKVRLRTVQKREILQRFGPHVLLLTPDICISCKNALEN